jgi:hypothetical protein
MATSAQSPALQVFLKEHLLYVHTKTEAGEYADAMAALQETKASVKDNIYVRAVEQQLISLLDLSRRNALTDERRAEILEPITGIIERAIGSLPQIPDRASTAHQKFVQATITPSLGAEEKRAALDGLKVKYFEQAGKHLSAGEYDLAYSEIQRVFVIDPDDATAKQYESVIAELMKLKPQRPTLSARGRIPAVDTPAFRVPLPALPPPLAPAQDIHPEQPLDQGREYPEEDILEGRTVSEDAPGQTPVEFSVPDQVSEPIGEAMPNGREPVRAPATIRLHDSRQVFSQARQLPADHQPHRARSRILLTAAGVFVVVAVAASAYMFLPVSSGVDTPAGSTTSAVALQTEAQKPSDVAQKPVSSPAGQKVEPASVALSSSQSSSQAQKDIANSQVTPPVPSNERKTDGTTTKHVTQIALHTAQILPVTSEETPPTINPATPPSTSQAPGTQSTESTSLAVAEPDPEPFIAVEKDPQLVRLQKPEIPDVAWQNASELQVILRVMVDAEGKPVKVKVLKGDNPGISNAAANAVMKSTFTPGIMGKAPVTAWLTLPLKFRRNG